MSVDDYARDKFNAGEPIKHAERRATLSEVVQGTCDFLKIDTDGADLQVLHGSAELFARSRPLCVVVEADLHGDPRYGDSSFAGIDEFMRGLSFTLLDISLERYERAAMPRRFRYGVTASSVAGPVGFADATYVDDPLAFDGKLSEWLQNGLQRCFKLLVVCDLLGFSDCAAELILALSRHPLSKDSDDWLALLAIVDPEHEDRMARFKTDVQSFY